MNYQRHVSFFWLIRQMRRLGQQKAARPAPFADHAIARGSIVPTGAEPWFTRVANRVKRLKRAQNVSLKYVDFEHPTQRGLGIHHALYHPIGWDTLRPNTKNRPRLSPERCLSIVCSCYDYSATTESATAALSVARVSTRVSLAAVSFAGAADSFLPPQDAKEIAAIATNIKTNFFIFLSFLNL